MSQPNQVENTENFNTIMDNYSSIILNDYTQFKFEDKDTDMHYIPVFSVGTIDETLAWARHARRIKFTKQAIKYFSIPEKVVVSNIENRNTHNYYYDDDKPYCDFLIGKTVGVVRRKVVNGQKIDIYHCPKYELIEIEYPHMFHMCTAKLKSIDDGSITEDINIARIAIPELMKYD